MFFPKLFTLKTLMQCARNIIIHIKFPTRLLENWGKCEITNIETLGVKQKKRNVR